MSLGSLAIRLQTVEPVSLSSAKKRTLVVDDSETILHAICSLLDYHNLVEVAGRAESGTQAVDAVLEMDADMPGMSGLRTALLLGEMAPRAEVIMMSMDTSPRFLEACAGCGAKAVIYKPKFLHELSALLERPLRPSPRVEAMAAGA
jgi:DNA-binding NarL/FixJ family response regulator